MDDVFGEIECSSKSDAIVMRLLRSAMDNAHEKVQSKDGPIEFLHERSKFYELAAILVDGGLSIVEEEADILETSRQKMLSDLTEIKDWLQRRIEEMRILITEKDKELMESVENELKLRHALELNERELVYLREKIETVRSKSEDLPDFSRSSQEIEDGAQGSDIGELKNSVDQQVSNIKQKLEDECKSSTRRIRGRISRSFDSEFYSKLLVEERDSGSGFMEDELFRDNHFSGIKPMRNSLNPGKNNLMIQQMSSDIDILKGTLDLAFGRMQSAEMLPLEMQWRWSIEKDTMVVAIKGFISDIQQHSEAEFEKRKCSLPVGFSREKWKNLINDARDLHDELQDLFSQMKVEDKRSNMHELSDPPTSTRLRTSEPLPEVFSKLPENDSDPSGSHYVAKMVKNHESFIQKQREHEKWSWLTREVLQRKGSSSVKRDKDPDELESRIQKAIMKLDYLINWDVNLGDDTKNSSILEASTTKIDRATTKEMNAENGADLNYEIRELKQERDDLKLQILIVEEIYLLLFVGFTKSLNLKLFNDNNESFISSDDDNHSLSVNDVKDDHGVKSDHLQNKKAGKLEEETECEILRHYLESTIREDVYEVYFQETILEWNADMECYADYCLFKEEILRMVFGESIQCIEHTGNVVIGGLQMQIEGFETLMANPTCSSMLPETVGSLLKEDVYTVYFRELSNTWRREIDACYIEILIKEDIYEFVILEMVKESYVNIGASKASDQMRFSEDFPSTKFDIYEDENLIEKARSCSEQLTKEEMASTSSQTEELRGQCDEVVGHVIMEILSNDDQRTSSTVREKLEISSDKLLKRKAEVLEMDDDSGMTLEDQKADDHHAQVHPTEDIQSERHHSCSQPEENEVFQQNPSLFSPLMGFQQVLVDFDHVVHKMLELTCWRMDRLKHQINALSQPAAAIRKKKLVYKKAFLTRCHNLRLAETEVDLLGNQVDKLLCLLHNIYVILHQNSTVLSQYFGVFHVLKLIKKELAEGAPCIPGG